MEDVKSKVVIVGGGIVGPTLALLLKKKGYKPTIVEKVKNLSLSGIAIAIHPNGLKVLNQAGVAKDLLHGTPPWKVWYEYTSEGEFLGGPGSTAFVENIDRYGWPCVGMSRTRLQLTLRDVARRNGIEYLEGWKLSKIRQTEDDVIVEAEDGRKIQAAFVIGCDGLKSATRESMHAEKGIQIKTPDFTGIAVIGGTCPTPTYLKENTGAHAWYGDTQTMISHPLEGGLSVWGLNYPMKTAIAESWRTVPDNEIPGELEKLSEEFKDWAEPVRQLLKGTNRMMTIGLYDRPEMPSEDWFYGRCMVIGDAAHPGTPHIGQGANQGLEDCWHLSQALPDYNGSPVSRQTLEGAFRKVANLRQPTTARLVKLARTQGDMRVLTGGAEARKERDNKIRNRWQDRDTIEAYNDQLYQQPFEDKGGYAKLDLDNSI